MKTIELITLIAMIAANTPAGVLKTQNFDADIFATGAESGIKHFSSKGVITHAATSGTDLGFFHDGLVSTTAGQGGIAGVVGGEFQMSHYSSTYTGSALDFGNPRTGAFHFDSVAFSGYSDKTFSMDIHDMGSNTGDDDVVVRLLVNGTTEVVLLDTRPQANGTAGSQTLTHTFADAEVSAQLLIDVLSDDLDDGYGFDNIVFSGTFNPHIPSFDPSSIIRSNATATELYSDTLAGAATESDGDEITYAKIGPPDWLIVNGDGTLSGTPGVSDMGNNIFTVTATDHDGTGFAQLSIEVLDENGNPEEPSSETEHYRVTWDGDPTTSTTVAWKQLSGANGTVHYGTTDFGRAYTSYPDSHGVDKVGNFENGGILSCFSRLTGLQPDTAYYFVIKDEAGVSPRFWFLTAPNTPKPFTFIGGGDSRSNPEPRRKANRMVAKLRPLFVLFTGDMIATKDSVSEWNAWFEHWQETISSDGRIYPLIPYRGNHEGYNASDNSRFFELFDTTAENYYAFSVGGNLMRFYVLNSEMDNDLTKWNAQTHWLTTNLMTVAASHTHLAAGYHKPMRPHNAAKAEGVNEYNAWAQPFYDHGMDLVFEADSHTVKRTWPIKPDGTGTTKPNEGFVRSDTDGTVYTGEGCWGAPLRASDDLKIWTRDSGVFNSFDWIHIYPTYMELYTVKVDNEAASGSLQEGDVFSLPSGIDLWKPANGTRVIISNQTPGTTLKSYAQWQLDQWGTGVIPANTEALANFDGDKYNNLTEFAYGLDPKVDETAGAEVLPVIAVDASSEIGIDYRRETDTSLIYVYEFSSDLITWNSMLVDVDFSQTITSLGDGNERVEIELLGNKETAVTGFIRITYGIQ